MQLLNKTTRPGFNQLSEVKEYLLNLDKLEKIDLKQIAPNQFETVCKLLLDCQELSDINAINDLILASKEVFKQ